MAIVLIALHKPYGVLCAFTGDAGQRTLAQLVDVPSVYPAGRLDLDSEGLVLLTDDGALQHAIASPRADLVKRYHVQVEGVPTRDVLASLTGGVDVRVDGATHRAVARAARLIDPPAWPPRDPPIRYRAAIPTTWIEVDLSEGRNRQVRRMTAAIGHPTLRLVRVGIGALDLFALGLEAGAWRAIDPAALGRSMKHLDTQKSPRRSRRGSTLAGPRR